MTPRVTVVVPVRDDARGLERCLRALDAQDLRSDWDVVVADNGSLDSLEDLVAAHPRARLVHEPRPGSYVARNAALVVTDSSVVAFTDADCLPRPDWLRSGLQALDERPAAGAVAGRVEVFARGPRPTAAELYEVLHAFPQESYVRDLDFGVTANLFVRRETLEVVGLFDPHLRSGGDADWGRRAAAAGRRVAYAREVTVAHPARVSVRELIRKTRRVVEGGVQINHRHEVPRRTPLEEGERVLRSCVGVVRRTWADPRLARTSDRVRVSTVGCVLRLIASDETRRLQRRARRAQTKAPAGVAPPRD